MAGSPQLTSFSQPVPLKNLNGGLNSTAGGLGAQNNESTDLQNIDLNKFGSILKRNGYTALNTTAITASPTSDGLSWFEYDSSGTTVRFAINVGGGKFFKMDDLDGTWDDITGALTITSGNHCDFENWLNQIFVTNGQDPPFTWTGSGNGAAITVPASLTKAKFVKQFNNYLFLANVVVGGTSHPSRIYWSDLNTVSSWTATSFIDIAKNNGQAITGIKVLSDRLVVFKERSIYNVFFTGNADIPFTLPGGGKSNSPVGCVAPFTIQEVENGLVFLSFDGFYYYDGNNSFKLSDKITTTLLGYNTTRFSQAVSTVQKYKNRYMCSLVGSGTTNSRVVVWDYFNNAFSIYTGIAAASLATFYVSGVDERPYFGDYAGFVYRMDSGIDDYPLNVATAVNAYYYTNWINFDDLNDQKGVPHIVVYYQTNNATLTFAYSYDFESTDTYTQTFSIATGTSIYGTAVYGTGTYAGAGGAQQRRDLDGRGRVLRFKFANSTLGEAFQIDGFGAEVYLETDI